MKEFYLKNKEDIDKIFQFVVLIAFIYIFIKFLSPYFAPLIFGYIICLVLSPVARFFNKKLHLPRQISSFLSIVLLLLFVVVISSSLVSKVVNEAKEFIENSPQLVSSTVESIRSFQDSIIEYLDILPDSITENSDKVFDTVIETVTGLLGSGVKTGSVEAVKVLPNILFVSLLSIICAFFLLNDRKNVEAFFIRQLPKPIKNRFNVARSGLLHAIGGYIRAELTLMCIVAAICVTGLVILKSPYALLIGILISVVDALPVFGSGAIFWPWCIYSIIVGNYKTAIGLAVIDIVIIITRQMLEPRILGDQIGMHPLATLMSIFIGLKVFGLFGFILGPIILVTINAMQQSDLLPKWK